jgi:hypothetical protein
MQFPMIRCDFATRRESLLRSPQPSTRLHLLHWPCTHSLRIDFSLHKVGCHGHRTAWYADQAPALERKCVASRSIGPRAGRRVCTAVVRAEVNSRPTSLRYFSDPCAFPHLSQQNPAALSDTKVLRRPLYCKHVTRPQDTVPRRKADNCTRCSPDMSQTQPGRN